MTTRTRKPTELEAFRALVTIRDMGIVNMWGAAPVLRQVNPGLTEQEASAFLVKWIASFRLPKEEQPKDGRESREA